MWVLAPTAGKSLSARSYPVVERLKVDANAATHANNNPRWQEAVPSQLVEA